MLVLADPVTGDPLVVQVSSPRTTVCVADADEHVVRIVMDDGFNAAVHLVLTREVAARLLAAAAPELGRNAAWLIEREREAQPLHLVASGEPGDA